MLKYLILFLISCVCLGAAESNKITIIYDPHHFQPFKIEIHNDVLKYWPGGQYNSVDYYESQISKICWNRILGEVENLENKNESDKGSQVSITILIEAVDGVITTKIRSFKSSENLNSDHYYKLFTELQVISKYLSGDPGK